MPQKKLLFVATVCLAATSAPLFAAHGGSSAIAAAAVKTTSQANVQAESSEAVQAPVSTPLPSATTVASTRANASPYVGIGITMVNNKGFTGLMPKVMAGFGAFLGQDKKYYGALEIGGGAGTILLSTNNQRYRVSNFFNLSILPGYMLTEDLMLYARLGVQTIHYSRLPSNRNKTGGLYGIGFDVITSQHWDARFEYNYANNKNLNQYIVDAIYKFR